jgi:hypothetical protein
MLVIGQLRMVKYRSMSHIRKLTAHPDTAAPRGKPPLGHITDHQPGANLYAHHYPTLRDAC